MNDMNDPCPVAELQVSRISDGEWRVADGRLSDASPSKVLGFIQRRGDAFDVLHIAMPDRDLRFDDWNSALASFEGTRGSQRVLVPARRASTF